MKPENKVHFFGPITGGGFYRTLCEHEITYSIKATTDKTLVTCQNCHSRLRGA